jgi:hypothetical protein
MWKMRRPISGIRLYGPDDGDDSGNGSLTGLCRLCRLIRRPSSGRNPKGGSNVRKKRVAI